MEVLHVSVRGQIGVEQRARLAGSGLVGHLLDERHPILLSLWVRSDQILGRNGVR
jgi:hypothetical protein